MSVCIYQHHILMPLLFSIITLIKQHLYLFPFDQKQLNLLPLYYIIIYLLCSYYQSDNSRTNSGHENDPLVLPINNVPFTFFPDPAILSSSNTTLIGRFCLIHVDYHGTITHQDLLTGMSIINVVPLGSLS